VDFSIDVVSPDCVYGWAIGASGIKDVAVFVDGVLVGSAITGIPRPDVSSAYPDSPQGLNPGFWFNFKGVQFAKAVSTVEVTIEDGAGHVEHGRFPCIPTPTVPTSPAASGARSRSPFPSGVHDILVAFDPRHDNPAVWSQAEIDHATDDLVWIIQDGSSNLKSLSSYLVFLSGMAATYKTIAKRFPRFNANASADGKDLSCVPSTQEEMLCISNHLFVLHSRGLQGAFTEFGCFKGFSSSCLSHACYALGIEYHIFDSFQGLPPSESSYYQGGEFSGSIDEVVDNVTTFGQIAPVKFFQGFFSETVPLYAGSPLAIWMDVDLMSSARDVMALLPRLPRESVVFTHECVPENFRDGTVNSDATPDHVLPPILAAFERDGRSPTGTFLAGNTGAIWDRNLGIPTLDINNINRLIAAATR
jgi:O-methyltransferase